MAGSRISGRVMTLAAVVLVAAFVRLLPLPPNFSPIAALALFAGFSFRHRTVAFALPLVALLLSDLMIGLHGLMWATYLGFALITALGQFLRGSQGVGLKALGATTGTLLFFVITNFAVWLQSGMYEKTSAGLTACYIAALPFLDNALAGDLIFTAVLFGGWALVEKWVPALSEQTAA